MYSIKITNIFSFHCRIIFEIRGNENGIRERYRGLSPRNRTTRKPGLSHKLSCKHERLLYCWSF